MNPRWPLRILAIMMLPLYALPAPGSAERAELAFVYIHGFGGLREQPAFHANMQEFVSRVPFRCRAENYAWDSVAVDVLNAGASWRESEKRAGEESTKFRQGVIERLERERTPYVLVGFSIGSRVGEGDVWWNKILKVQCRIDGRLETVEIEQSNMAADYFRALLVAPAGRRTRIARGKNPHAILRALDVARASNGEPEP